MLIVEAGRSAVFVFCCFFLQWVDQTEGTLLYCSAIVMARKAFATPVSWHRVENTRVYIAYFSINSGEVFVRTCQKLAALWRMRAIFDKRIYFLPQATRTFSLFFQTFCRLLFIHSLLNAIAEVRGFSTRRRAWAVRTSSGRSGEGAW